MNRNSKGFISIFLALIILPTYLVATTTIDMARIYSLSNYLKLAQEATGQSLIFSYDKDLYQQFGLFASPMTDETRAMADQVFEANMSSQEKGLNKAIMLDGLYEPELTSSLASSSVLEKQIIDYMKYQAALDGLEGLLTLVDVYKETRSYQSVLSKKLDYHEKLSKLDIDLSHLRDLLINYREKANLINKQFFSIEHKAKKLLENTQLLEQQNKSLYFSPIEIEEMDNKEAQLLLDKSVDKDFVLALDYILEQVDKSEEELKEIESFYSQYKDPLQTIAGLRTNQDLNFELTIKKENYNLDILVGRFEQIIKDIVESNNQEINKEIEEFREEYDSLDDIISQLLNDVNQISQAVQAINQHNDDIDKSLHAWKEAVKQLENTEFKNQFEAEYVFSNKLYSKENINAVVNQLERNTSNLIKMSDFLSREKGLLNNIKTSSSLDTYDFEEMNKINKLADLSRFAIFKGVVNDDNKPKTPLEKREQAKQVKKSLLEFNNKQNQQSPINDSLMNYISQSDLEDIMGFEEQIENIDLNYVSLGQGEINDIQAIYNKNQLNGISDTNFLNHLLIAQYIASHFNNKILMTDGFVTQQEYILFGHEDLAKNQSKISQRIFSIRFGLNSIYAFSSVSLRKEALALATAIAGWSGIGIPIVENIILSLLALGETFLDLKRLEAGNGIETFKNNANWQLSLNGLANMTGEQLIALSQKGLDYIFDQTEQIIIEAKDMQFSTINAFIMQTQDGLIESIKGTVILPIQNKLISLIQDPSEAVFEAVNEQINQIEKQIEEDGNELTKSLKKKAINIIKTEYIEDLEKLVLEAANQLDDFMIGPIDEMTESIEKMLVGQLDLLSQKLTNDISEASQNIKENTNEIITNLIKDYLKQFTSTNKQTDLFTSAGLSFDYSDYMKLLTLIYLNTDKKEQILNRIAVVIDIEMKKKQADFSITNNYTSFGLKHAIEIPLIGDKVLNKGRKKIINHKMQFSY